MNGATKKPTARQRALLNKLMLSSTFSAEEAHRTAVWLASPAATKDRATEVIDDALSRIKNRNEAQKDSADRKAEYHANKDNGDGEYPPKRYSQDHPPNGADEANGSAPETSPAPPPAPAPEVEQKIYRICGVDYTDKNEAATAASKAIFG